MKKSAINRQRGSIILPVAVSILVGLILLGGVQLGYYFYMKRELQNTADMAVLSGVQMLSESCQQAKDTTKASITQNFKHDTLDDDMLEMECGTWRTDLPAPRHFVNTANAEGFYNALRVSVNYNALPFMPFSSKSTIAVEAIAKSNIPVAAFQVGSQLLRFDKKALLGNLLGFVGLDVDSLTLLDSKGLADVTISPSGLLDLLEVDLGVDHIGLLTPQGVAGIRDVSLLKLLNISLEVVKESPLGVDVDLTVMRKMIDAVELKLGGIKIPIGDKENQAGLFAFLGIGKTEPLDAALDVQLGIGDLLKTAIALGANGHALEVPELDILGLVQARLSIVEPPVIAIGPIGTTGHSAQIRLWLDIDTDNLLGGLLKPLVSGILGTRVHLPITLDIVSGTGKLTGLQCSKKPHTMNVSVNSKILNVCVGKIGLDSLMSDKRGCEVDLGPEQLVKLLHIPILSGSLHIPALTDVGMAKKEGDINLKVGDTGVTDTNPLALGTTVDNLVTGLLNLLGGLFQKPDNLPGGINYTPPAVKTKVEDIAAPYLKASRDGIIVDYAYNKDTLANLLIHGTGEKVDPENYLPPLLPDMSLEDVKDKFKNAFDRECVTNLCIRNDLHDLLEKKLDASALNQAAVDALFDGKSDNIACTGPLCIVIKPILTLLKPILNGLGGLLKNILDDLLGLELGRTEVTALAIECDPAQLVY
ncbi:MAG: pilus assembly protein TadG-related protein [Pseudomonas sp.]|nr:pilus assembly protein TadG-related protein [Pseudomonas sp.]